MENNSDAVNPAPLNDAQKEHVASMQATLDAMYAAGNPQLISLSSAKNIGEPLMEPLMGGAPLPFHITHAPGLQEKPDGLFANLGLWTKRAIQLFVSKNPDEIEKIEQQILSEHQAIRKFEWLEKRLEVVKMNVGSIVREVESYQGIDIARTLLEERFEKRGYFVEIFGGHGSESLIAAQFIKAHGDEIIKQAKAKYDALEKEYLDHKRTYRDLLKKRGLI